MNQIICYPVPDGIPVRKDIKVRVRALGEEHWRELAVYEVKVDMHDVHEAGAAYFDFEGSAEVELTGPWYIYQADIRPLSYGINYTCDTKTVRFTLNKPVNLSIELNKERNRNLHLFSGRIEEAVPEKKGENTLVIGGSLQGVNSFGGEISKRLSCMPRGRILYLEAGIHYIRESVLKLPSDTEVYMEGGCILIGGFICSHSENIHVYGRGVIYQAGFHRFSGINGLRLSFARKIRIDDIIFINPPHYTIYIGGSQDIRINNIKAFSCEGWSDGIDIMNSRDIEIKGGFLRNSDDCIAIYASRWDYRGSTANISVKGLTLWADVAHPLMIGTHGDYDGEGDTIEEISFEDMDILEHNEYQEGYLGCMAINAGDKNYVRKVSYENIRVEPFKHGKLLDIQVKFNTDYNPAPGRLIEDISFQNIYYNGSKEVKSQIKGYGEEFPVRGVSFKNLVINDKKADTLGDANVEWGDYAYDISIE